MAYIENAQLARSNKSGRIAIGHSIIFRWCCCCSNRKRMYPCPSLGYIHSLSPFSLLHLSLCRTTFSRLGWAYLSQQYWLSSLLHSISYTHSHIALYKRRKKEARNKVLSINYFTSRFNSVERSLSSSLISQIRLLG